MSEEQRQRMEKSGMGIGGGLNKGEDNLFGARHNPPPRAASGLVRVGG